MEIPFQQLVSDALHKKQLKRAKERGDKGITSWQASKLGLCQRGILLERWGFEPDEPLSDRTLRVFDMGSKIEDWLVELLKKQKAYKVETQVRIENLDLNVSGYADVVLSEGKERKVYEIKSKHSGAFSYMKSQPPRHNAMQLWIYLHCLGLKEGGLVYVSKDDMRIMEFPIYYDDEELAQETLTFIETLNKHWKAKTLPELVDKKHWSAKYCNFHKQCQVMDNDKLKVALEEMKLKNLSKNYLN